MKGERWREVEEAEENESGRKREKGRKGAVSPLFLFSFLVRAIEL